MDWTTANQYLLDHPRYKTVPETVALPTYVEFEQKLRESCRAAFNELLLERIELFDALSNVKVPTSEHIATVESQLKVRVILMTYTLEYQNCNQLQDMVSTGIILGPSNLAVKFYWCLKYLLM